VAVASAFLLARASVTAAGPVRATYLHTLANFSGKLPYDWVRVHADPRSDETYVLYQNLVRVFSASGMEVFSFGDGLDLGQVLDAAVDENGDVILLSYKDSRTIVTRCSFRGVPIGPIDIRNLPEGVEFRANRFLLQQGRFYFVSTNTSTVIVTDADGTFREHIALLSLVDATDKEKDGAEVIGFTVDGDGNLYFTVPVMFRVFKLTPDQKLSWFGRPGSAAGRFGVVSGVAVDSRGNVLVADKVRSVVMVFDKEFNFLIEFGYRGLRPENLFVPDDLAVDRRDRLYVSQGRRRGVSVFALSGD
jgi:hypothetical protein